MISIIIIYLIFLFYFNAIHNVLFSLLFLFSFSHLFYIHLSSDLSSASNHVQKYSPQTYKKIQCGLFLRGLLTKRPFNLICMILFRCSLPSSLIHFPSLIHSRHKEHIQILNITGNSLLNIVHSLTLVYGKVLTDTQ